MRACQMYASLMYVKFIYVQLHPITKNVMKSGIQNETNLYLSGLTLSISISITYHYWLSRGQSLVSSTAR